LAGDFHFSENANVVSMENKQTTHTKPSCFRSQIYATWNMHSIQTHK